jgi:hypothetical protein
MKITLGIAVAILLSGCAGMEYGASSILGSAPMSERHSKTGQSTYYIEILGNGAATHRTLLTFFEAKANELCNGLIESRTYNYGNRFPHGRLEDIRLDSCLSGGFCNRTQASWPLVYGAVQCKVPS